MIWKHFQLLDTAGAFAQPIASLVEMASIFCWVSPLESVSSDDMLNVVHSLYIVLLSLLVISHDQYCPLAYYYHWLSLLCSLHYHYCWSLLVLIPSAVAC